MSRLVILDFETWQAVAGLTGERDDWQAEQAETTFFDEEGMDG